MRLQALVGSVPIEAPRAPPSPAPRATAFAVSFSNMDHIVHGSRSSKFYGTSRESRHLHKSRRNTNDAATFLSDNVQHAACVLYRSARPHCCNCATTRRYWRGFSALICTGPTEPWQSAVYGMGNTTSTQNLTLNVNHRQKHPSSTQCALLTPHSLFQIQVSLVHNESPPRRYTRCFDLPINPPPPDSAWDQFCSCWVFPSRLSWHDDL